MTEQTITTQFEQSALDAAKPKQPRQLIRFTFYKLDAQWQVLTAELRKAGRQEILSIIEEYEQVPLMRSYGLYGVRSDCVLLKQKTAYEIEDLQGVSSKIRRSVMGPYLRETHAFLSMTKRSIYVGKNARGAHDPRLVITPEDKKYLFVRSEEHTSELQSHSDLVCRLLL